MLAWLAANLANIVIIVILAFVVGLAVRSMIRNKKAGKSSCGCDCDSCGACAGSCAMQKKTGKEHRP